MIIANRFCVQPQLSIDLLFIFYSTHNHTANSAPEAETGRTICILVKRLDLNEAFHANMWIMKLKRRHTEVLFFHQPQRFCIQTTPRSNTGTPQQHEHISTHYLHTYLFSAYWICKCFYLCRSHLLFFTPKPTTDSAGERERQRA